LDSALICLAISFALSSPSQCSSQRETA
jgi:hypothetical protein